MTGPVAVDTVAYRRAVEIATPRRWRASDVYETILFWKRIGASDDLVERLLTLICECASEGESFAAARLRIGRIAAEVENQEPS